MCEQETPDYGRPVTVVLETGLQSPDEGPVLDPDWSGVLRAEVRVCPGDQVQYVACPNKIQHLGYLSSLQVIDFDFDFYGVLSQQINKSINVVWIKVKHLKNVFIISSRMMCGRFISSMAVENR